MKFGLQKHNLFQQFKKKFSGDFKITYIQYFTYMFSEQEKNGDATRSGLITKHYHVKYNKSKKKREKKESHSGRRKYKIIAKMGPEMLQNITAAKQGNRNG